jgi:hypothetical protein
MREKMASGAVVFLSFVFISILAGGTSIFVHNLSEISTEKYEEVHGWLIEFPSLEEDVNEYLDSDQTIANFEYNRIKEKYNYLRNKELLFKKQEQ